MERSSFVKGSEGYDSLPFRKFTTKSEADKAINTLKGILVGIDIDGHVSEAELSELLVWSEKHYDLINRNPFREFMQVIKETLKQDDAEKREAIHDLFWLCQKYESDSYYYNAITADLQTLQGICHGILADGIINDDEVKALDKWLEENEHLATYYPYDELRSLVISVLSDGKISDEERKRLIAYFNEFVNLTDRELTQKIKLEISDVTISGICTVDPDISFTGKTFCFTGVSKRANRSEIEEQIRSLGGNVINSVSKTTDYLIIGDGGNPCWAFACYGRKVEAAVALRKQGYSISLVHEFDFWDFVEDNKG